MSGKSYEIEIGAQSIYKISLNRSFESSGRVSDATWIAISNWREIFDIETVDEFETEILKAPRGVVIQYPPARFILSGGSTVRSTNRRHAPANSFHNREKRDDNTMTKTLDPR